MQERRTPHFCLNRQMPPTDEDRQRTYYQATAASYHQSHVSDNDEHGLALELLVMLARNQGVTGSFLDVGAGTGRAMKVLSTAFPQARVEGIEPVAELRQQAELLSGISSDVLRYGNALELPFADDSFDWVVETGVLHHIRHWSQAVREMARVARFGVLISDTNNIGQGTPRTRQLKKLIKRAGLWNALVWLQTKGKMSKWSKGDGVYYSFCAFDALPLLRSKFPQVQVMNTQGSGEADLLTSVSHVAIIGYRR
jgi:ubiquinone/menaquinone biosynthesis C-methylase UbiE